MHLTVFAMTTFFFFPQWENGLFSVSMYFQCLIQSNFVWLVHGWLQLNLCILYCINSIKLDLFLLMSNSGDNDIFHFYLDFTEAKAILVHS